MTFTIYRQHDWHTLQHSRRSHHSWRSRRAPRNSFRPAITELEDRALLSISLSGVPDWHEQGPGPIKVPPGITPYDAGAINAIVVAPTDPSGSNIYIGSVNGGVWHTTTGRVSMGEGQGPTWTPLTDFLPSLGIGTLALSPQNHNVLFAGTPGYTNARSNNASAVGVFRTTDAGLHWDSIGQGIPNGTWVNKIVPSTLNQVVLVATDNGIYRSEDGGDHFDPVPVLSHRTTDLIEAHPGGQVVFFAGVPGGGNPWGGVYRSTDGRMWTPVTNGIDVDLIKTKNVKVAVHDEVNDTVVYAMVADDQGLGGTLTGVFRSTNQGDFWTSLGVPAHGIGADFEDCAFAADPINPNLVYFGGYGIFATWVGDASNPDPNTRWTPLWVPDQIGPHADHRIFAFDPQGDLLEGDDGGIYRLKHPRDPATRAWESVDGDLRITEMYAIGYDNHNHVLIAGTQDNGDIAQSSKSSLQWNEVEGGDGTDQGVDNSDPGLVFRYSAINTNPRTIVRRTYDLSNHEKVDQQLTFTGDILALNTTDPKQLLIADGSKHLFESPDRGVTRNDITSQLPPVNFISGLAYSGDIAYVGATDQTNKPAVFLRTTKGSSFTRLNYPEVGGFLPGTHSGWPNIALDSDDGRTAYFVDDRSQVWQVAHAGLSKSRGDLFDETWTNITGNLKAVSAVSSDSINPALSSVEMVKVGTTKVLLVSDQYGVYRTFDPQPGFPDALWTRYGSNLPFVRITDMVYDMKDDVFAVGTFGRGAWTVVNAIATIATPGVLLVEGDSDYPGEVDTIRLVRDPSNPTFLDVYVNSTTSFATYQLSTIQQINVNGLGGNDTLIVDSSNGGIPVPIAYDGGTGSNALKLQGGTDLTDTYAPGPNVGSGTSTLTFTGGVETIEFQNLAPVLDTVSGPLTVAGTAANDVINYGVGSVPTHGLVTVNNFESIEFTNKTNLTFNAGAGDDTITINNPNTPTGLTAITADGGPGIDTLVVNALGNAVNVANTGTVQVTSQLPANYRGIEKIQILNAPDQPLKAVPATIQGTEGAPLTDVVVGGFSDGPNTPGTPKGKASDVTATIDWGDGPIGNPDVTAGQVVDLGNGNFQVLGSHTYSIARTYTLTVTITDNGSNGTTVVGGVPIMIQDPGGQATQISTQAAIVQAPLVAVAQPIFGVEGNAIPAGTLLATFIDNGGAEAEGNYSATVDFGQGPIPANVSLVPGSTTNFQVVTATPYTFNQPGTYSVRMVITNNSGPGATSTAAQTTTTATIAATPLTPVLPVPVISTIERVLFTGPVAAFTSANPAAQPGQFTATIDWGDGTPTSAGLITQPLGPGTPFVVVGSHTYADAGVNADIGTFPLTIDVVAITGASVNIGNTASVADVPIDLTGGLNPASDTGVSNSDAITSINQPNFTGKSEPNSTIQLFAQPTAGGVPQLVGQTTADASGSWNITTNLLADDRYIITAAATDATGHTKATREIEPATHPLVIDTVGPKITGLTFDRVHGRINVTFQDELTEMDRESPLNAANYLLSKQQVRMPGAFTLTSITTMAQASPSAPQTVVLTFHGGRQIRGGHYTFTILSGSGEIGVRDAAGNALDGEFYGSFPSGNGHPGGNFVVLLDAIHRRIDAPKSAVGSATPVVPTPPTIIPVSNPKRAFVGVRAGLRPMGQHNRATSVAHPRRCAAPTSAPSVFLTDLGLIGHSPALRETSHVPYRRGTAIPSNTGRR